MSIFLFLSICVLKHWGLHKQSSTQVFYVYVPSIGPLALAHMPWAAAIWGCYPISKIFWLS